jgi:hypothetical protein
LVKPASLKGLEAMQNIGDEGIIEFIEWDGDIGKRYELAIVG